jgi:hypothetical protein
MGAEKSGTDQILFLAIHLAMAFRDQTSEVSQLLGPRQIHAASK